MAFLDNPLLGAIPPSKRLAYGPVKKPDHLIYAREVITSLGVGLKIFESEGLILYP